MKVLFPNALKNEINGVHVFGFTGKTLRINLTSKAISVEDNSRITSYNVCYTKLLRGVLEKRGQDGGDLHER